MITVLRSVIKGRGLRELSSGALRMIPGYFIKKHKENI